MATQIGSVQVNATDYDSAIVIERFGYAGGFDAPIWSVPAWGEIGQPDLAGPFATVQEAQTALDNA